MPERSPFIRWFGWLLPHSLLGRLSVVMLAGVMLTQMVGNFIWSVQLRVNSEDEVRVASQHLAHSAANTAQFFLSLPPNYRPLVIQQFRKMGGTRFFVNLNHGPLDIQEIEARPLTAIAMHEVALAIKHDLPNLKQFRVGFAYPENLVVADDGSKVNDLPENWVQHILLVKPDPAPILVIQAEMEPGHWLYLASLMPNPYFLESSNAFSRDRIALQALSLAAVLLLSIMVVRWMTRPLAALSESAEAFGNGEHMPDLPETGSSEFINTARAFEKMRKRIQRYIEDRERLFVSISHDLRTPIMRLKLRAELLDDDALRGEFHEDLDDLDMMVKGALQCVKDSDIHENPTAIQLDALIDRMIRGTQLAGHDVSFTKAGLSVTGKPLALKRALGNLLDNALHYGAQAEISVHDEGDFVEIHIRDHGPGVPEHAFNNLFQPYVRLEHGRTKNESGLGLGLGIARDIVQAHGGELRLNNHSEGGLLAVVRLPAALPLDAIIGAGTVALPTS
jgi:signal transduction histidine kinase